MRYILVAATILLAAASLVQGQCSNYPCTKYNAGAHLPCEGDNTKFWLCNQWISDDKRTGQVIDCCETSGQILIFNPITSACELPTGEDISTPATTPSPSTNDPHCPNPCNKSNEFSKVPCPNCTEFWMCNQYIPNKDTAIKIDCCSGKDGAPWHFNPETGVCAPGDCPATTTSPLTEDPTTPPTEPSNPTTDPTTLPPTPTIVKPPCPNPCNKSNQFTLQECEGDCTHFWMCNEYVKDQDTSILIDCCEGKDGEIFHFDKEKGICVPGPCNTTTAVPQTTEDQTTPPTTSLQTSEETSDPTTLPPKTPVTECPNPCNKDNQFTLQPDPCDCTKFWMCNEFIEIQVTGILIDCCADKNGEIWHFDVETSTCILGPCNTTTTMSPTTEEQTSTPTTLPPPTEIVECPNPCNKDNEFTLQPDPCNCTLFWMCNEYVEGQDTSILIDCCEGKDGVIHHFDKEKGMCVPGPCDATTTSQPTTETTENETSPPTIKPVPECPNPCNETNQFTLQPDPCDCTKFYMCNEYVVDQVTSIVIDCCEGKDGVIHHYDEKSGTCVPGDCNTTTIIPPTTEENTSPPVTPVPSCPDPCNKDNQFTLQPYECDCTHFWMCNEYVENEVTSILIDCCADKNGETWYFDRKESICTTDPSVCQNKKAIFPPINKRPFIRL